MYSVGGGNPFGQMPEKHNLVINLNHPNAKKILSFSDEQRRKNAIQHVYDLALLSQNMLKGEDLLRFVERTSEKI